MKIDTLQRFLSKIKFNEDTWCWEWQASKLVTGYGIFALDSKRYYAHRYAYETFKESILNGNHIDHLCHNPSCVNPEHLDSVTRFENLSRSRKYLKERKFCKNGHELIESNLDKYSLRYGHKKCKICINNRQEKNTIKQIYDKNEWQKIPVNIFQKDFEQKYLRNAKLAIRLELFSKGINTFSRTPTCALRYLRIFLAKNRTNIEELSSYYNLTITRTKLRKKLDGVLAT